MRSGASVQYDDSNVVSLTKWRKEKQKYETRSNGRRIISFVFGLPFVIAALLMALIVAELSGWSCK